MSLPPERISIKRRRQDEPVDTLVLEHGSAHDKKRQFTDFFFQRLRNDKVLGPAATAQIHNSAATTIGDTPKRDYQTFGIPTVRQSAPGDEIEDFNKYRSLQERSKACVKEAAPAVHRPQGSSLPGNDNATHTPSRRFHLAREISPMLRTNPSTGIRRPNTSLRPPLATFIERHNPRLMNNLKSIHKQQPVDSIVQIKDPTAIVDEKILDEESIVKKTQINAFHKSSSSGIKRGISIRDDPTTWDQDSDQLANELAALAFDMDSGGATEPPRVMPVSKPEVKKPSRPLAEPMVVDNEDEFVFETYIRVKHDSNVDPSSVYRSAEVGVLVIDDENEDLWERYIRDDDDDDEWDEEDEDSNAEDNPRNEYPDDEVSTDDEYGRMPYKYRHHGSDDEQFDEDSQEW